MKKDLSKQPGANDYSSAVVLVGEAAAGALIAGTLADGVGLVIGAAALPIINHSLAAIVERRAGSFRRKLDEAGLSPEALIEKISESQDFAELVANASRAALASDFEEKHALLAGVLQSAAMTKNDIQSSLARRVIGSIERIDVMEVAVLRAIQNGARTRSAINARTSTGASDALDSVFAVLASEGAVTGDLESAPSVTGFGKRILQDLASRPQTDDPVQHQL